MSDQHESAEPVSIEFHLSDDDLPPEALKDCCRPPQVSTLVHCLHCNEEYDSWRMVYRVTVGSEGRVQGFWECPIPGCSGAGFQIDIFPIDPNYIAEDGQLEGEWVDEHEEDCKCEDCEELRAEIEADLAEWERKRQADLVAEAQLGPMARKDVSAPVEDSAVADRRRINEAMAGLREPDDRIPLDDLLPECGDDGNLQEDPNHTESFESGARAGELTPQVMMEIEKRLGLHVETPSSSSGPMSVPQVMPHKPVPLPPNWRELLARQDEDRGSTWGPLGEEDIPF